MLRTPGNPKVFVRRYREIMDRAVTPYGFRRLRGNYVRILDHLLHVVCLHKSNPWAFTGDFAVQPLMFPFEGIIVEFGTRIDEVVPGRQSFWQIPEDADGVQEAIQDFADATVNYAVPWLDRFPTCRRFVEADMQKSWGLRRLDAGTREKNAIMIGLCALSAEMPEAGRSYLDLARMKYRSQERPDRPIWFLKDLRLVDEYLQLLEREDWDAIHDKLAKGEAFTRRSIGLPPVENGPMGSDSRAE